MPTRYKLYLVAQFVGRGGKPTHDLGWHLLKGSRAMKIWRWKCGQGSHPAVS